jgi:hypothetical protein
MHLLYIDSKWRALSIKKYIYVATITVVLDSDGDICVIICSGQAYFFK